MFVRPAALFVFLSASLLAAAMPNNPTQTVTLTVTAPAPTVTTVSQCNTGDVQCCQSVEKANSASVSLILALLGIVLDNPDVLVGLDCSPLTVIGVGTGNACSSDVVCCENNNVGGLISIGCAPVSL